uniref:Protein kinase domain-containing protein n=1 Tax=Amphiprion ocellaris TaxID=80972 RepID=A0A3Q1C8B7_AMPOC
FRGSFNNGLVEVYNMKKLKRLDADKHYLVKLVEHFKYKGHICLAYELLSETLFDFLKRRDQRPLDVAEIRQIACQMLMSLKGLKSIGLTHTDIKLDNIMLCDRFSKALKVKLIDFGCAAEVSRLAKIGKIQAVGYRAPEVILGLPITEAIDMWSLGAVLATLFVGGHFYPTVSEYEQLRMIVHVQGLPKDHLLKAGRNARQFFTESHDSSGQAWRMKTRDEYEQETGNVLGYLHTHSGD